MTWINDVEAAKAEAATRPWIEYPFPLRPGEIVCQLTLPRDLSKLEATRLAGFIHSLVVPESPE